MDSDARVPIPQHPEGPPLVYVTMGTVVNDAEVLALVIEASTTLPVRALVTSGPGSDALDPHVPNIRVEAYVPEGAVLGQCDAVIARRDTVA